MFLLTDLTPCSRVSVAGLEQVNTRRVYSFILLASENFNFLTLSRLMVRKGYSYLNKSASETCKFV